jgi:hypothetical protein
MASRVAVYTLRIMGPDSTYESEETERRNQEVKEALPGQLSDAEALLNELLPEGYYAKIEDA